MSEANDAWNAARDGSPPRDRDERMPSSGRDRSRSPGRNGDDRGRAGNRNGGPGANQEGSNLHVSGLSKSIDIAQLDDIFSKYGKVQKAEVMFDPHTQESRGFGFVKMETGDDAQNCISNISGTTIAGKVITVAVARRGRARTPTPGRYHGVKVEGGPRYGGGFGYQDRPYQPRSYDSRYNDRGPPRDDERRFDDRRYDDRRHDDRRYDDRRHDDRRERFVDDRGAPPADRDYHSRSDRERGYERREERPRYDERPPRY